MTAKVLMWRSILEANEDKLYEDIRYELKDLKTVLLVGVYFYTKDKDLCLQHLEELGSLSDTYGFEVLETITCPLKKIDSKTYIGKGKLEEIGLRAKEIGADVIIFDEEISPNQQRNLEKILKQPIIDRTELILEVFSQRAKTKEAALQIELAKSEYQLPRLKRLWTHLSRQTSGGKGFTKGEGERQIELDRRMIRARISRLRSELKEVRKQRGLQRHARKRSGTPTFAIIGYTNSGKSTLLNALTDADILAEDKLFATLDTTTRKFTLPNHQKILLIDTVGFIRKIPHNLVEAFKSTLEEAAFTDILLHLIDVSHPMAMEQSETTHQVLKELNITDLPMITLLNKVDLLEDPSILTKFRVKYPNTVEISALNRTGFDLLGEKIMEVISFLRKTVKLKIPQSHYDLVSEVIRDGKVISSDYEGNYVLLEVEIPGRLEKKVRPFLQG